jgi:hypothetical protein
MTKHLQICAVNNAGLMYGVFSGDAPNYAKQNDLIFAPIHGASDAYHAERPHQGLDNSLIESRLPPKKRKVSAKSRTVPNTICLGVIHCHQRLGGLLKNYSRKAA